MVRNCSGTFKFLHLVISLTKCIVIVSGKIPGVSVCLSFCVCVCLSVQSRLAKLLDRFWRNFPKMVSPRFRGVRLSFERFGFIVTSWRPFCWKGGTTVWVCVKSRLAKLPDWFWQNFPKTLLHWNWIVCYSLNTFDLIVTSQRPFCWENGSNLWFCVFDQNLWAVLHHRSWQNFLNLIKNVIREKYMSLKQNGRHDDVTAASSSKKR